MPPPLRARTTINPWRVTQALNTLFEIKTARHTVSKTSLRYSLWNKPALTDQKSEQPELLPNTVLNGYKVVRYVGEGAFAKILVVEDITNPGQQYAMKILKSWSFDKKSREQLHLRFDTEFKIGQIRHPLLVASFDKGDVKGNPFHIQEFMEGGDLRSYTKNDLPWAFVNEVALNILRGIQCLHENGIIHRDIKPDNIYFDRHQQSKIGDFGIACRTNYRLTAKNWFGKANDTFGTIAYAAPEQLDGKKIGPQTDLFSFGATMFDMISGGILPFGDIISSSDVPQYVRNINQGEMRRLSYYRKDLPEIWKRVIELCLLNEFNKRINNTAELIGMLEQAQANTFKTDINRESLRFKNDVFISFSTEDKSFAEKIFNDLRASNLRVFFAPVTLRGYIGQSWQKAIRENLMESQHLILVCSAQSFQSEWVGEEWETFYNECYICNKQNRRLIPIFCHGFTIEQMEPFLRKLQIAESVDQIIKIINKSAFGT